MKPSHIPSSHTDRPQPRATLPIRISRGAANTLVFHFDAINGTEKIPCMRIVGDETSPSTALYNSYDLAVWQTMQMFWELEGRYDEVLRDRDELLVKVTALEGEAQTSKKKIDGFKAAQKGAG